jgi:hypothetical protein
MSKIVIENNPKVFLIGFVRCGAKSISNLFKKSGYSCCDWSIHKGDLGRSMYFNFSQCTNLIHDKYKNYTLYSDMDDIYGNRDFPCYGYRFYKTLEQTYPNAKFILNTRPLDQWIEINRKNKRGSYFRFHKKICGFSDHELFLYWSEHYKNHTEDVKNYFFNKSNKLLVFDISKDDPRKIVNFFKDFHLRTDYFNKYL